MFEKKKKTKISELSHRLIENEEFNRSDYEQNYDDLDEYNIASDSDEEETIA